MGTVLEEEKEKVGREWLWGWGGGTSHILEDKEYEAITKKLAELDLCVSVCWCARGIICGGVCVCDCSNASVFETQNITSVEKLN